MKARKDELIDKLSAKGDRYGSELLRFMNEYGLINLMDATVEQLEEYVTKTEKTKV